MGKNNNAPNGQKSADRNAAAMDRETEGGGEKFVVRHDNVGVFRKGQTVRFPDDVDTDRLLAMGAIVRAEFAADLGDALIAVPVI